MKKILLLSVSLILSQCLSACNATANKFAPQQGNENEAYLLKPTGNYAVGFQDFHLIDGSLKNGSYLCPGKTDLLYTKGKNESDFSENNQTDFCREIMVRIYYPSVSKKHSKYENYYAPAIIDTQNNIRSAKDKGKFPEITEKDIQSLSEIKTFTIKNPLPVENQKFPVLIFTPGAGVEAQQYENTISNMVSHGYVALAVNNTFVGSSILFPDGRVVHMATSSDTSPTAPIISKIDNSVSNDILFVRNALSSEPNMFGNLTDMMDTNKIGLFGHSVGGISTIHVIRTDSDKMFQAAISFDALPTKFGVRVFDPDEMKGFSIPFLRLFAAEWRNFGGIITPNHSTFELLPDNYYALLSPDEKDITYTNHGSFIDVSTLQYQPTIKETLPSGIFGTANGWDVAREINRYVISFFDQYLKNKTNSHLESCTSMSKNSILTCAQNDLKKEASK